MKFTEDRLEQAIIELLRSEGYPHSCGENIDRSPEDVLIKSDLREFLATRYQAESITNYEIDSIIHKLEYLSASDLYDTNKAIMKFISDGFLLKREDHTQKDLYIQLIDYDVIGDESRDSNHYRIVSQMEIQGYELRIPDGILYINGLPLVVFEFKSTIREEATLFDSYKQLTTRYKRDIPELFKYNALCVISDGVNSKMGSFFAPYEFYYSWRKVTGEEKLEKDGINSLLTMIGGLFNKARLVDVIRNFIYIPDTSSREEKVVCRYPQYYAATKLYANIKQHMKLIDDQGRLVDVDKLRDGKGGTYFGATGCGKSFTMLFLARLLMKDVELGSPTIVLITDRTDLDDQLAGIFTNAKTYVGDENIISVESRADLRERLKGRKSGGVFLTTIHKFTEDLELLTERANVICISDEAHRSQYGLKAKLGNDGTYKFGYAKHMRDALKNAAFIGFTGTPISSEDKDTRAVFGDYVSIYDIQDAVDDGATVPIYYESRLAKLDINKAEIEELSDQVDEVVEDEEDVGSREKTKSEWSRLEKLVGATPRLKQIAADLVAHFDARTEATAGKGMIVTMSREICVHLYNEIIALRPDWHDPDPEKGKIKIVMTGSASDKPLLQPHIYNKQVKKRLEKRFKDVNDPLQLVIVRDMWLTGFDAPCTHTMYIDKPMKGHNLMQAIARVNRVFKDKQGGLVVDYIGIANELKQALKTYTDAKGKGEPTLRAEEAYAVLAEKMDAIRGMFAKTNEQVGMDLSAYETQAHRLIIPAANYVLSLKDGKKRFLDLVLAINKAFSLCSTLDEAKNLHKEIAFYSAIKAVISKHTSVDRKLSQAEKDSTLKQILDNAVIADGVTDVFAMCGLDKPNIGLLSDEFLEDVRQMPYRNLAVELLEKLLNDGIKAKTRNNVVQEKRFSDRLQETLRKYNNRAIETSQVIEELIQMAKEFQAEMQREAALGLNPDEIAFYDALANNESAVRELGDDTLKQIAREITEKLRKSTTVDWQVRDSVRAQLKILVRRTLQRWKYPPDKAAEAIELVMKQAETLSNAWTCA